MRHGLSKIPACLQVASATRLSQGDPWLSVLRLLGVWLYRQICLYHPNYANVMPEDKKHINILILLHLLQLLNS
jgi:hypothetical protein